MNIQQVWEDMRKMQGEPLMSILKGRDIEIVEVTDKNISVKGKKVKQSTWSYNKMYKLVQAMSSGVPIHVDTVLNGSGSSRNQPETLLANLPYVEWLIIDKKKHVVWVKQETHRLGTTKEVDKDMVELHKKRLLQANANKQGHMVVFTRDLPSATAFYKELLDVTPVQQDPTHTMIKKDGLTLILRVTPEGFQDGQAIPMIVVDDIDEYVRSLGSESGKYRMTLIPGKLSVPDQMLIEDLNCLQSIIASRSF